MAFTIGNKTLNGKTIEVIRIEAAQGNGNGQGSAIYTHTNGGGKPTQEMSMSETVFVAEGWTDV